MRRSFAIALLLVAAVSADAAKRRAVSPGGSCPAGATLATDVIVFGMAMDATHVYFHEDSENTIRRVAKSGGESVEIYYLDFESFAAMAIDDTHVYVAAFELPAGFNAPPARIYAIPKDGGEPEVLASNVLLPFELVVDDTHVYWSSAGTLNFVTELLESDGRIERVQKDGSGRQTLVADLSVPLGLVLDGDQVIFAESGLARDDFSAGLRRVAKDGGPVTHILEGPSVLNVALSGDELFFLVINPVSQRATGLYRMAKNGGGLTTLLESSALAGGPRVRDGKVYYLTSAVVGDTISYLPTGGGAPTVLVNTLLGTDDFEIDSCRVYYATFTDELVAVPRP